MKRPAALGAKVPNPVLWFGLGYVVLGLLAIALAVPLIRGRVPPNHWYGVRIPASFQSEEAWYRINHHGGKSLLYFGLGLSALGSVDLFLLPAQPNPALIVLLALSPLLLLVPMLIHIYRYPRQ